MAPFDPSKVDVGFRILNSQNSSACGFQSLSLGVVGRLLDEPKAGTELERNLETPKHCSLGLQSWIHG
jgi:hypothetical protein